jgi:hypothetical protein
MAVLVVTLVATSHHRAGDPAVPDGGQLGMVFPTHRLALSHPEVAVGVDLPARSASASAPWPPLVGIGGAISALPMAIDAVSGRRLALFVVVARSRGETVCSTPRGGATDMPVAEPAADTPAAGVKWAGDGASCHRRTQGGEASCCAISRRISHDQLEDQDPGEATSA